jgi:hypothetical protein
MQPPAADNPPDALALVVADRREEVDELAAIPAPSHSPWLSGKQIVVSSRHKSRRGTALTDLM